MEADTFAVETKVLLKTIVIALVDDPNDIEIKTSQSDSILILELVVKLADRGKIIGKGGKTAISIRHILKCWASRFKKKIHFEIINDNTTAR